MPSRSVCVTLKKSNIEFDNLSIDRNVSLEVEENANDFHSIIDLDTQKRVNHPKNIEIGDHLWVGFNSREIKEALSIKIP